MKRRLFSLFLALTLVVGMLPAPAFAQETEPTQVTEAPTEAPATEAPATEAPAAEPTPAPTEALAPETTVAPAPTEAPTEAPATEAPATEAPAAEPTPAPTEAPVPETTVAPASTEVPAEPASTEDEAVTAVQAMIDALPDVDHMSEEYIDALVEAYSAYDALSESQQAKITDVEKLEALFGWVNSQVSTLAEDVTEISGEKTWDNQTFIKPVQLTGNTTLTLTGTNRIECDQPLDLNGFDLTIRGSGTLELVGKGGSKPQVGATLCDGTWTGSSSSSGGTLTLAGGTVKVSGSQKNAVCVYSLKLNGGNLEAHGSRAGIVCALLETTSGSLYATGDSYGGICMYSPFFYGDAVNKLTILVSNKRDADPAEMESADADAIKNARSGEFGTVYIGEVTGPMFSVKAQKGYLYEGVADQKATFAISHMNLGGYAVYTNWEGTHAGLNARTSLEDKVLTVTADETVKEGTYTVVLTGRHSTGNNEIVFTKKVTVTVLGAPITITTQPKDASASCKGGDLDAWQGDKEIQVAAKRAEGLTEDITYQWKLKDDTELEGFNQSTLSLKNLYSDKKLTPQADKSWLSSAEVYCTLTVGTYSVKTETVTLTVNTCDYQCVDHVDGKCLQCGEFHTSDPLLVSKDGYFVIVPDESGAPSMVGGNLVGGGTFFLTKDVTHRGLNAGNATKDNKDTILDLQKHTLESLDMGNFPYGSFTLKNGTLNQCIRSTATEGKLILDGVTFMATQATNNSRLEITVKGESVFKEKVSFSVVEGVVHLRGGTFEKGIDTSNGAQPLALLDEGFAYQNSDGDIVDASYAGNIDGIKIQVVAHTCKYVNGKCECGRTCDHKTVDADGYCTVCKSLVYPYAIGEVRYTSLEDALTAANAGDTITLRGDFYQGSKTVEINKSVTLNLGDHTLTGDADAEPVLRVLAEKVTIQNGTVQNTRTAKSSPAVTVGKTSPAVEAGLTVKSVTFIGSCNGVTPRSFGLSIFAGNTAQVENGTFTGGISVNGSLTLSGGKADHIYVGTGVTYASLLAKGYAYQAKSQLVKPEDMVDGIAVEVVKCGHPDGLTDTEACAYCGLKCAHPGMDSTTGNCTVCGLFRATASVAAGGTTTYFADFGAAVEAAKSATGSTLTLLRDVTLTGENNLYIASGTFTIDWNGHTLSGKTRNNLLVITYAAKVTLKDSLGNGGLRNVGGRAIGVYSGGGLTIQGGVYSPQLWKDGSAYGPIQISGGRFENPEDSGMNGALYCDSGALVDLLAPGYTFAYEDNDSRFDVYGARKPDDYKSVYVVEHPTHELDDDTDTCACGFHCDHKDVGDDGVCAACGNQMAASVTAGDGSVTYYRNIAGAIAAATASPGSTVTLLNDIDETISNDGMDFVLDLNGKTLAGLELKGYHFALMDSQQTGTIEQLYSEYHVYLYLKEGWCLVDADGMSLNLLTRLDTSDPIHVVHAGVVDIERSKWGTVSYGKQTIPFSLRFRLEDGLKVSSVKVSWTYEVAVREPIGSVQTLTKDEDGFYTFDTSKPLDEHPLNYGRLRAELTHVLLSQIELELEDGQTRRIVLSGYYIRTEKADLSDAVITLDSTALTYAPNPQTAVGQEQTKTVTSVTLYGNTLTEGTDYEVTGNVGTDAGTYTLTVKAKADSAYYTGDQFVNWEIVPLHAAVADTSLPGKTYDGTAAAQVPVLTMQSGNDTVVFRENTDYILKKAEFSGPNVGAQMIRILIGLTGDAAKNYQLEQNEWVIMSEITPATPEAPTTGTLTVTNGNVTGYTLEDLESLLAPLTDPCTYGTITYGTPTVEIKDKSYTMTAEIVGAGLKLNVTGTGNTEGRVAVVTVPVQTSNYRDFTLTVYVEAKNKTVPQVKAVGTTEICYGQKLEESRVLSSQVYEPDSETTVPGSFRWEEPETLLDAGTHPMKMIFTPEDTSKYAQTTAMVNVTVNPRPVTLSGVTVADKIYDGTAEATVKDKGTFSNAVSGDTMDYTVTAAFEDKNVAAGGEKTAYLSVTLNGDTGKNYTLAEDSQKEARARMFPKEVNITGGFTAQDRDYAPDETTVTITKGTVTFAGKLDGDDLDAETGRVTTDTPEAGQNKAVTYSATLTGEDKDNYILGSVPDLTVTIRPIAQTLAFAETAVTKTYGDSPFVNALDHSAGDGQITYTSSDPAVATVGTDGTVTIRGAGEARITATAAATQNYVETAASFDLTVDKATGTVKNRNYSRGYLYGDDIPTPERKYFEASSTGAFRYSWSPAAPKNAGKYQLTVTVDEDGNYTSATLVLDVLVEKDVWARPTLVKAENETIGGKKDGKVTYTHTPALEYRLKRTRGEWIPVAVPAGEESVTVEGLAPETYEFRRPGDENHFASSPETITIQPGPKLTVTLPSPQTGYTLTADKVELSWHDSLKLTLTVAEGYYKTASLAVKAGDRVFTEDNGTYTLTDVEENLTITLEGVEKDEKAPWLALQNWTFGKGAFQGIASPKDWKNISTATAPYYVISTRGNYFAVEAWDGETGLASVSYLLSKAALTREALEQAAWEPVPEESLNLGGPDREHMIQLGLGEWYFYVKAVDKAGNVSYVGSDKLIREENAPTFGGVTNGATYYTTQKVTITDDYALSRYLPPLSRYWKDISGTSYEVTLEGNREGTYTMKAEDACQNTGTLTVTMKPISALTEDIRDLTEDNVQMADDAKLTQAEKALKALDTTHATDEEKKEITEALDNIGKLKTVLEEVTQVEAMIAALPERVEPWDAETEKRILDTRSAYDAMTDHQKTMVDDSKLRALEGQLVDYRFTSGENQTWALGCGKELRFTVNGQLAKVKEVRLNGQAVDTEKTAQAKGTDFALKASYLQGLKPGSYTLQVLFMDGQTPLTQFTVTVSPNYLDLSGYPDFDNEENVTVNGRTYPIGTDGGRYVNLPETGDLLTIYSFKDGTPEGSYTNYPTGMQVFRITRQEGGAKAEEITEFANLLNYAGCSIRLTGTKGIRMITGIGENARTALTGARGLGGYTLEEYGTVVMRGVGTPTLENSHSYNFAYKKGKADPVFARVGGMIQYTNVLVGFSLEDCKDTLTLRPYIKLKDMTTGETVTLYGGCVSRSIGYIAKQNENTYQPGTAGYKYVHEIIDAVYGKTEQGGETK